MLPSSIIIYLRLLKDIFRSLADTCGLFLQFSNYEIALRCRCRLLSLLVWLLGDKAELWQLLRGNKSFQVFNHSVHWYDLIVLMWLFDSSWRCACSFILSVKSGRFRSVYKRYRSFFFAGPMNDLWYWYNYSSFGSAWGCAQGVISCFIIYFAAILFSTHKSCHSGLTWGKLRYASVICSLKKMSTLLLVRC